MANMILVINGPNLDMLGTREPDIYGRGTLRALEKAVRIYARQQGMDAVCFQSNSEGELIKRLHSVDGVFVGVVYNPGAHTHYSYALRDAIASVDTPVVEVHLSDVNEREAFRRVSVIAPACVAQVKGLGIDGYYRAIDILAHNEGLERLGEGYEDIYDTSANIIVAGQISGAAAEPAEAPSDAPSETLPGIEEDAAPEATQTLFELEPVAQGVKGILAKETYQSRKEAVSGSRHGGVSAVFGEEAAAHSAEASIADDLVTALINHTMHVNAADPGLISLTRQDQVRLYNQEHDLDAFIVRDTSSIRWLTAFENVFDDERAHALVVARDGAVLHTDSRYARAAQAAAQATGGLVDVVDTRVSHAQFAYAALVHGDRVDGSIGFEDNVTFAEYRQLEEKFGAEALKPTHDAVLNLRACKDATEIERLRAAQAITDAAFAHIIKFMQPGLTEREVQVELEDYMMRHGAEGLAFRSIVACGANGADPHAQPGETRLEAGQCVVLDFGARALGYCSDMTRVVFLGKPSPELDGAYAVLREANERVEAMLRAGVTGKQAHDLAEQVLADGGYGGKMGHGLGHGVGIDIHEAPNLNTRNEKPLVAGNVVTVEPGIYIPGRFGMRLEDCGVITDNGFDVFTQSPHDMVVL